MVRGSVIVLLEMNRVNCKTAVRWPCTPPALSYHGYRFPPEIISHAVWLYNRFCLNFRDVEDLLAEWDITESCEAIRQWCRIALRTLPIAPDALPSWRLVGGPAR